MAYVWIVPLKNDIKDACQQAIQLFDPSKLKRLFIIVLWDARSKKYESVDKYFTSTIFIIYICVFFFYNSKMKVWKNLTEMEWSSCWFELGTAPIASQDVERKYLTTVEICYYVISKQYNFKTNSKGQKLKKSHQSCA